MAHRYFIAGVNGEEAYITGPDAVHLAKVLRVKPKDVLTLCDGAGNDYEAEVEKATPQQICLRVLSVQPTAAEPSVRAEVYLGYARGERMEWAIQKAVELGAVLIQPFFSRYCVVRPKNEEEKNRRYTRIAHEAAKQAGRGRLPAVELPVDFDAMLHRATQAEAPLFFYEEGGRALRQVVQNQQSFAIITGPEGGFSPQEAQKALDAGCTPVGLGPRILRSETAPAAALAALMTLTGNLE